MIYEVRFTHYSNGILKHEETNEYFAFSEDELYDEFKSDYEDFQRINWSSIGDYFDYEIDELD